MKKLARLDVIRASAYEPARDRSFCPHRPRHLLVMRDHRYPESTMGLVHRCLTKQQGGVGGWDRLCQVTEIHVSDIHIHRLCVLSEGAPRRRWTLHRE